ncbi:MAG: ACP S-malonyltransferase [Actinobacteria bacterium]|nr:ACP S-malonyltransferase [Actinomycetota bacterium]
MTIVAFLYPGQGSQKVGMGAELLAAESDLLDGYLAQAEAASGQPIRRICLEGPIEALTRTEVAQPALFAVSLALTDAARARGIDPDFVAGHSLGEYTAACAAGSLSVADGIELVSLRGQLMARIGDESPGAMAAVIGLSAGDLERLCEDASGAGSVALANINSPTQIVVSGEETGVVRLMELAEGAGASRVVRLQVAAAFHSELMQPVREQMAAAAREVAWSDPRVPVAVNARGELVRDGEALRTALVEQIASPVRWVECVEALAGAGVETFLELGPGRVLGGLVRQIQAGADVFSADSPGRLEEFAEAHPAAVR